MKKYNFKEALPDLYRFLTGFARAENIFCLAQNSGTPPYLDLMIVLPGKPPCSALQMMMAMELAMVNKQHMAVTVCSTTYLEKMLAEGHIYYALACNEETLVHDQSGWKRKELDKALKTKMKDQAYKVFYSGLRKAHAFWAIAKVHQEHNLGLAIFMLQQAMETCLYALTKALTGSANDLQDLEEMLVYSFRYNEQLPLILMDGSEESRRILDLLDDASQEYCYNHEFEVESKDVKVCLEKADQLNELAEQTFLDWAKRYELI